MRLSEQLKVLSPTDRIRIIQGKRRNRDPEQDPNVNILFCGYLGSIQYADAEFLTWDPKAVHMVAHMEIRHKHYKEKGLIPPYEPDVARMYEFKDLTVLLYYDIYIQ